CAGRRLPADLPQQLLLPQEGAVVKVVVEGIEWMNNGVPHATASHRGSSRAAMHCGREHRINRALEDRSGSTESSAWRMEIALTCHRDGSWQSCDGFVGTERVAGWPHRTVRS